MGILAEDTVTSDSKENYSMTQSTPTSEEQESNPQPVLFAVTSDGSENKSFLVGNETKLVTALSTIPE